MRRFSANAAPQPRRELYDACMKGTCIFCDLDPARVIEQNASAVAIADGFPVSPGHTLVIPRRHAASYFDMDAAERQALWDLVETVRLRLDRERHPDGFNIGINVGEAAGQTVMHMHIHVIPRYVGDMADPRGGVRHVIPGKGKY